MKLLRLISFSSLLLLTSGEKTFGVVEKIQTEGKDYVAEKGKGKVVRYSKNGARSVLEKIPGGKFIANVVLDGGDSDRDKLDRIDKNQKTSLQQLQAFSATALAGKRYVENMYFLKKLQMNRGRSLAEQLRKSQIKKLGFAALQDGLGFPINPAVYVPNIPPTSKLKKSIDFDLSLEENSLRQTKYLFSHTRSALLASGLAKTDFLGFQRQYPEAKAYDKELKEAIKAKEIVTAKIYRAEIERLEKENLDLEETLKQEGLKDSFVLNTKALINQNKTSILLLDRKLTKMMEKERKLSSKQKAEAKRALLKKSPDPDDLYNEQLRQEREKYKHKSFASTRLNLKTGKLVQHE